MKLQDFSIIKWIYDNDLKIETGLPFSWKDHMYLYDIYRDFSPKQVIYKAAQIGYSTLAVLKSFWIAKNLGIDITPYISREEDKRGDRGAVQK